MSREVVAVALVEPEIERLNQPPGLVSIEDETTRFRRDVELRPEVPTLERYDEVPVHEFGAALLRGMGWSEGKAIGRNASGLTAPVEFVPRQHRLGLGAAPKAPELPPTRRDGRKYIPKPGESVQPAAVMVAAPTPDGRVRHIKTVGEELVPYEVALKLQAQLAEQRERSSTPGAPTGPSRPGSGTASAGPRSQGPATDAAPAKAPETPWLATGLHVRLVSKSFRGGNYYNRKGVVTDIVWTEADTAPPSKRSRLGEGGTPRDGTAQELRAVLRLDDRPHDVLTGSYSPLPDFLAGIGMACTGAARGGGGRARRR